MEYKIYTTNVRGFRMHPNLPTRVDSMGGEGEGAQNASTRICNFPKNKVFSRKREVVGGVGWSVKRPIIPIYTLKEISLQQSSGYNPDVLSQTYRTRLNRPSECGPHSENFPGSRLHVP